MNEIEFLNYLPTPNEKYFMGIATVRLYGRVILKYKVIEKKDGTGFFISAPNYRLPVDGGDYKYVDAIMLDSRMEHDDLMAILRTKVTQALNPNPQQHQQPPPQQTTVNYQSGTSAVQPQQQNFAPDLNSCPF